MNKTHYSIVIPVFILFFIPLACSFPSTNHTEASTNSIEPSLQVQPSTNTPQPTAVMYSPTQVLPRPTHQFNQSSLPKPTIPVPPALVTRQPQSQVISQPTTSDQSYSSGDNGDFYVSNFGSITICYFYMALSSNSQWGEDQLGQTDVIYSGETYTITGVPYGTYDAQALDCDGNILGEVYGFDFPPNDMFSLSD